ncbi:MAG: aminotransferase class V-fold PLP-dependent enzyme [Pyrinomonadaceae bacterium]|nr:aminotransferase class V-fold PLP-dependent enzyme [Pyrinomonadaceae bacterium]
MILNSRRSFLSALTASVGTLALAPAIRGNIESLAEQWLAMADGRDAETLARDEAFWAEVRKGFDLPEGILNLDNGYCNPLSREVMADLAERARYTEQLPGKRVESLYEEVTVPEVIGGLARVLGVPANELALVRNATEALDTVILGLPMKAGDEIVCCTHDYYAMLDAIEQRRTREGITVKMLTPPLPAKSQDELVEMYAKAITPKTKLVMLTHVSNMTGQIFPVKKIAAIAHRAGAEVVVDGAQTMALLEHKITDLDCDYYGASLHKWLMAPVGAGVLWMRKENIAKVWPLVPSPAYAEGMLKYSWSGTYPEFISASAAKAIRFYEKLGSAQKEERMRYLTSYWRSKVEAIDGVRFYTTDARDASCGLGIFDWKGVDLEKVQKRLWEEEKILVQYMSDYAGRDKLLKGMRVTPNIYTSTAELDRFIEALRKAAAVS